MNATLEGETTGFPISLFGTTCSTALYYLSPAPRPPAAAGTGCSSGSQRGSAPRKSITPSSFLPQGQKSATEGKEKEERGSGFSGCLAKPDPGAGKMTSVAKVEQVLLSPSPTGESLCHTRRNSRAHAAWERLGEEQSPGMAWDHRRFGIPGKAGGRRAGAPTEGAGEHSGPALQWGRDFALCKAGRGVGTSKGPPTPSPGRAGRGSLSLPHPDPTPRAPRPSSSIRLLPNPTLRVPLLPPTPSPPRPRKVWTRPRAQSPALTLRGAEPKRLARDRTEGGGAWRRERGAPHSGPCCPGRRPS